MATHLEIPDSLLEEFRCSVCKSYLSSAPVQVLPDGKSICITCAPLTEQPTHRMLAFESLLSKLLFPCRFKQYGCKGLVPFGQAAEHEGICAFQPYSCPSSFSGSCTWKGSVTQICEHFTNQHGNLVQEKLEFTLEVDKNEEGILMTIFKGVPLIMKYKYKSSTSSLHHDVRLIALNKQEGTYKIQLTNDSDHDYSIATKGGTFLPYNNNFNDTQGTEQNWKVLFMNNFLQNLNNPSCVIVAINAAVSKFIVESNEQPQLTVDYDLIQSLRCKKCYCYLIPPLFQKPTPSSLEQPTPSFFQQPAPPLFQPPAPSSFQKCFQTSQFILQQDVTATQSGVVCFYCKDLCYNSKVSNGDKLNNRIANTNFPCRWRGCEFVEKGNNILEHELMCQFRIFNCKDCETTFMWEGARSHIESHGYEYFIDECVYKITFSNGAIKKMFTFKNKDIVYILHDTEPEHCNKMVPVSRVFPILQNTEPEHSGRHRLKMFLNDSSLFNITARVELEHAHCKIKSKAFNLDSKVKATYIKMKDLPACFKENEELTVTLKIKFLL